MFLCKVTGSVVSTRKADVFRPSKILVVHEVDSKGMLRADAPDMLALDPRFGAGWGDYVLVAREGKAAAHVTAISPMPANVVVLGVVDDWSYEGP